MKTFSWVVYGSGATRTPLDATEATQIPASDGWRVVAGPPKRTRDAYGRDVETVVMTACFGHIEVTTLLSAPLDGTGDPYAEATLALVMAGRPGFALSLMRHHGPTVDGGTRLRRVA